MARCRTRRRGADQSVTVRGTAGTHLHLDLRPYLVGISPLRTSTLRMSLTQSPFPASHYLCTLYDAAYMRPSHADKFSVAASNPRHTYHAASPLHIPLSGPTQTMIPSPRYSRPTSASTHNRFLAHLPSTVSSGVLAAHR